MRIIKRNIISVQEAERLIEKYYEGETSVAEEKLLHEFLSQKNLPTQFDAEKAIFGYFESAKQKKTVVFTSARLKWAASVVAVVAIFLGILFSNQPVEANYAYVDGKKITDMQQIHALAQTTVNDLVLKNTEMEMGLEAIRQNNVIENQLDVFSDIEF